MTEAYGSMRSSGTSRASDGSSSGRDASWILSSAIVNFASRGMLLLHRGRGRDRTADLGGQGGQAHHVGRPDPTRGAGGARRDGEGSCEGKWRIAIREVSE